MIDLKEAKDIAKKVLKNYDTIYDYGNAYYFLNSEFVYDGNLIVMKKNGACLSMAEYVMKNDYVEPKLIESHYEKA